MSTNVHMQSHIVHTSPSMRLSVQDAAALLRVSTKTIYRWVGDERLPAYRVAKSFRFDHAELLEWAMANRIEVSAKFLEEPHSAEPIPDLDRALETGGIAYRVDGEDRDSALRAAIRTLRPGDESSRDFIFEALRAREQLASTSIGDGIALPHVRNPMRLRLAGPGVSLCFLERPVDWGAPDRQPVSVLFIVLAPTVRSVLQLHSRTLFALRDPAFRALVLGQGSRELLLAEARRVAAGMAPAPAAGAL